MSHLKEKYAEAEKRVKELKEILDEDAANWEEENSRYKATEKATRELCEDILARNPEEMKLHQAYSWSQIPLRELIAKSKSFFFIYDSQQKQFLQQLLDNSEELREESDLLQSKIARLIEYAPEAKKEEKAPEEPKVYQKPTQSSIPTELNEEYKNTNTQIQKEAKKRVVMVDINEYASDLEEVHWKILELIGNGEVSEQTVIVKKIAELQPDAAGTKTRNAIRSLVDKKLITNDRCTVSISGKGKIYVHALTDNGKVLFEDHFGKEPAKQEAEILKEAYGTLDKGYDVKSISAILKDTQNVKQVKTLNQPVKTMSGKVFTPDIILEHKKGKIYIMCGLDKKSPYDIKKIWDDIPVYPINVICSNKNSVEKVRTVAAEWVQGNKKLRLVSAGDLFNPENFDLYENSSWKYTFLPEFLQNF